MWQHVFPGNEENDETELVGVHTGTRELRIALLNMLSSVILQSFNALC